MPPQEACLQGTGREAQKLVIKIIPVFALILKASCLQDECADNLLEESPTSCVNLSIAHSISTLKDGT